MKYRLAEIELSNPLEPIRLEPDETGIGLAARWNDRLVGFCMVECALGELIGIDRLRAIADEHFAFGILNAKVAAELDTHAPLAGPLPSLTVAICTKDRAVRLGRLLDSLVAVKANSPFPHVDILVVDNAPSDETTREAAARYGADYYREPKVGLNFARNSAINNARGAWIAYLDDDVVVDRGWLHGLAAAWRAAPGAGGFTGLVLPFRLDTEAQILFEERGGFGRGFLRREFRSSSLRMPLHPVGAGIIGAGCNMAFDTALVRSLGGFDDALDTGAPLPGGGDLDICYRVLRSGRSMVYEPQYAVRHEHRETIAQLRRQYWTWGLGMMAFLVKSWRHDPACRPKQSAMVRWWVGDQLKALGKAIVAREARDIRFAWAEFSGGIQGLLGEYDRSLRRVATIRNAQS